MKFSSSPLGMSNVAGHGMFCCGPHEFAVMNFECTDTLSRSGNKIK